MWCCNPNTDRQAEFSRAGRRANRTRLGQNRSTYGNPGNFSKNSGFSSNQDHGRNASNGPNYPQPLREQDMNSGFNSNGFNRQAVNVKSQLPDQHLAFNGGQNANMKQNSQAYGGSIATGGQVQNFQSQMVGGSVANTDQMQFSGVNRDQNQHDAYRQMMLYRLQAVGLNEDEFENYIRRDPEDLFSNVQSEKLQALATVINKKDFMDNYDLNEAQYAQIDQKFDISGKKVIMNQKVAQMTAANQGNNVQAPFPGSQNPVEPVNVDFAPVGRTA